MATTTSMSSSSNNNNSSKLLYSQRLVWMERTPQNWWPALTFANYGHVLSELSNQLSVVEKGRLSLTYISNPTQRVAQFVATREFIELSNDTVTRHFSDCIGQFYTAARQEELAPAMDIIKQMLAQDVQHETHDTNDTLTINVEDPWSVVWQQLRKMGWKKKYTKSGNVCWVFPGASRSSGIHGQDYFNTLPELQDYIRREYGWNGSTAASASSSTAVVHEESNKNKRKRQPEPENKTKRIWGRPKKAQAMVVSTPQNQATCPQDPAKPLLSDDEETRDYTQWKPLWDSLKKEGWTYVKATKYNILHDWYYVRPGSSVDTGTMGVDYFMDPTQVTDFVRAQDEQQDADNDNEEAVLMPSPRKRSRKARIQQELVTSTTSTTTSDKTITKLPPLKKKTWWFHNEPLPSFRHVWNILHSQLDFKYVGGCYKLPFGDETFACDLDMRCHLLLHGIPNLSRLSQEDATTLTRWVTFAHVPVKDTNSTVKLEHVQELTPNQALCYLEILNFVHHADGSICRGDSENESFASLEDARVHLRASASLAPPVQGRRARGLKFEISLSQEQVLELRVWAALSRTPLPTFAHDSADDDSMEQQEDAPTLAVANDASTATTTEKEADDSTAAAVEQEQDTSAGNVVASAKPKTTNSIVFESEDDDDDSDEEGKASPSFAASTSRVSLSPSASLGYQPLTQQE